MTIRFDLGHDLDFEFSRSNMELAIFLPKMVRLPWNEKQTYRLISRPQIWPSHLTLSMTLTLNFQGQIWNWLYLNQKCWGEWGCEVSCGGHHRLRGKTTTGSALDGAVFDIAQILAYLVHNMSRSQFYLGFGHFGWLPSFFGQQHFGGLMVRLHFLCWNYSLSSGWHIIAA